MSHRSRFNNQLLVRMAFGLLVSSLSFNFAYGVEPDVAQLRQEVEQLKHSMQDVQARLQQVEASLDKLTVGAKPTSAAQPDNAPATATPVQKAGTAPVAAVPSRPVNAELVALKQAWGSIKPGVPSEQVKALLGPASQELRINGKLTWYYAYPGVGAGSVFFNEDGRVSSRKSPFLELGW